MSLSLKLTDAAALRAYVERFDFNFLHTFFTGLVSKNFTTTYMGVKGRLTLTQSIINDVARRYSGNFTPPVDIWEFKPQTLDVVAAKIEASINPRDFENTYLGIARSPGFSHAQNPFEAFMLMQLFAKHMEEVDIALWQAVQTGAPVATDKLIVLFNGWLKIIIDALAAGDITAVGTGALTEADCVEQIESVYKALPAAMRTKEVLIFLSVANYDLYTFAYRENYSKNYAQRSINGLEQIRLDCGNAWLTPMPGMGTSNRVIATVKENIAWGTDLESDMSMLHFQDSHWNIDMFGAYKIGAGINILDNKMIRVNNQE